MLRVFVGLLTFAAGSLAWLAGCDDQCNIYVGPCRPRCPETFSQGDVCEWENMQCVFSSGRCRDIEDKRTVCACSRTPAGLHWSCQIRQCSCTCACGMTITASCDAVECAEAEDECPAAAALMCEVHCADAGLPDAAPDAGPDATADGQDRADSLTLLPDR